MQISAIAGRVFRGVEVSATAQARATEWIDSFTSLRSAGSRLTLWQIRDAEIRDDPGGEDKASTLLLESELQLDRVGRVPALILLHYRGTDPFNRDFQASQARRLGDILGMDWLKSREAGVFLTVHHGVQGRPERLEIGDHRVVCDFRQLIISPRGVADPAGLSIAETDSPVSIPELAADAPMVWRLGNASLRPLGVLPRSVLAIGSPVCPSSGDFKFFEKLVGAALASYGTKTARILFDRKSPFSEIADSAKPFWAGSRVSQAQVAITALPKGLSSSGQEALAAAEWPAYLPYLPWHTGRFVFGGF